jgi:hypothetical protein
VNSFDFVVDNDVFGVHLVEVTDGFISGDRIWVPAS